MNILIIGGAGYIGSHTAKEFIARGHRVTIYDNLSSGLRENINSLAAFAASGGKITPVFIHGDIHDYAGLLAAMKTQGGTGGFDAIIHLAASKAAGESMLKPEKYAHNNICGTINILNAACESGIRYIVFSSSAAVYGEPGYLPIDEAHQREPENFYGFTKLEIERLLGWYDELKDMRYACLRYFNAAGYDVDGKIRGLEQNPANLLPVIMEVACGMRQELQIFGDDYDTPDGTCIRDYIHVSDLATGHAAALDYIMKKNKSLIVNLG
ncbi:MAG: UDP-glucose 4-epimerase GalE, partial [Treponema sp.]|nr:UDP-glucose 4-epimerase GalE [Treponema sp.]